MASTWNWKKALKFTLANLAIVFAGIQISPLIPQVSGPKALVPLLVLVIAFILLAWGED